MPAKAQILQYIPCYRIQHPQRSSCKPGAHGNLTAAFSGKSGQSWFKVPSRPVFRGRMMLMTLSAGFRWPRIAAALAAGRVRVCIGIQGWATGFGVSVAVALAHGACDSLGFVAVQRVQNTKPKNPGALSVRVASRQSRNPKPQMLDMSSPFLILHRPTDLACLVRESATRPQTLQPETLNPKP